MITYHEGNVIDAWLADSNAVLIHGCNCFHAMNSGIAKEIRERFPEAYKADCENSEKGDVAQIGSTSRWCKDVNHILINAYTQFEPGANFEYSALFTALHELYEDMYDYERLDPDSVFYLPKIGAGIGGGNWFYIEQLIKRTIGLWNEVKIYTLNKSV